MTNKVSKDAKKISSQNNSLNFDAKYKYLEEIELLQLASIIESSSDAIISKDFNGNILTWNKGAENIFGFTAKEAIGQNIIIIFPPEMTSEETEILKKIRGGERIEHYETVRIKKDGSRIKISLTVSPIKNEVGEIIGISKIARDISRRVIAEESLIESEARFRHLADTAPVLIWMSGTDKLCNYFNKYWLEFTGRTFEEEYGNGWAEGIHPDDFDRCLEIYTTNFDAREEFEMEYRLKRADGEYRWILDKGVPRFTINGIFLGFIGSCIDITERKQFEKQLRESSEDFRALVTATSQAMWEVGEDEGSLEFEKWWKDLTGQELDEHSNWLEVLHSEDREKASAAWKYAHKHKTIFNVEYRIKNVKGDYQCFAVRGVPIFDEDGKFRKWLGTFTEITERKQAEKMVRDSEQQLRRVLDNLFIFVGLSLPDGTLIEVNRAPLEAAGISLEEVVGQKTWETTWVNYDPEVQRQMREDFEKAAQGEIIRHDVKLQLLGGSIITIDYMLAPVRDDKGTITHLLSSGADITERKSVEESLHKSEERYRLLFENNPYPMWVYDIKSLKFLEVNEAAVHHYGYSLEDFKLMTIKDIRPEEDIAALLEDVSETDQRIASGAVWKHRKKDGSIIYVEINSHKLNFDGKQARLVLANDLTDRKLAEESLREKEAQLHASDQRLAEIVQGMTEACFALDSDWHFTFVNNNTEKMLNSNREKLIGKSFWDIYSYNIGTPIEENFRRVMQDRVPISFEAFSPAASRWLDVRIFPSGDGIATFLLDINERKNAEEDLIKSEKRFRTTLDSMLEGVQIVDFDWKYVYVNDAFTKMGKYPREELIGYTVMEKYPGIEETEVYKIYQKCFNERVPIHMENKFTFPDKTTGWFELSFQPIPEGIFILSVDITERKHHEEEIEQLNETLENKVSERTSELNAVNKELAAFSYAVSHDLRAPLRAMDGFSLALIEDYEDVLDEDGKRYLHRIRAGSQQMAQLIDDMLKLSRVTRAEIIKEKVSLTEIAKSITNKLQENNPRESVNFEIQGNIFVKGDERLLRIAMENLLGNAYKFTSKCKDAKIIFGQQQNKDETVYFVRDNGAGFDMTYADKLFGAFQRFHSSKEFEGTGIGLATVQRVINRHGGHIYAESKVGEGATFYFSIS